MNEHELRHLDRDVGILDDRLALVEMANADLRDEVRRLTRRLEAVELREGFDDWHRRQTNDRIHGIRERIDNGRRLVATFGGEIDVGPAEYPAFHTRRSISLAELERWTDEDSAHEAEAQWHDEHPDDE